MLYHPFPSISYFISWSCHHIGYSLLTIFMHHQLAGKKSYKPFGTIIMSSGRQIFTERGHSVLIDTVRIKSLIQSKSSIFRTKLINFILHRFIFTLISIKNMIFSHVDIQKRIRFNFTSASSFYESHKNTNNLVVIVLVKFV